MFLVAVGTALVTTIFGATGGSLAGYKMNNRVGHLKEFEFVPLLGGTLIGVICS